MSMFADAIISSLGYLWWNLCCGERRSRRLLDRERLALHARLALAFAFLKNTKEKVCFASYGKNAVYLTSYCLIFPVFEYFRRSDLAQPFRFPAFACLAVSSSQPFRRLVARRISERSDDRKYLCVCRLVVCMTELLIYRPVQFYSGKNFEFTCKSLDHSPSENSKKHFQLTQSKFATETS